MTRARTPVRGVSFSDELTPPPYDPTPEQAHSYAERQRARQSLLEQEFKVHRARSEASDDSLRQRLGNLELVVADATRALNQREKAEVVMQATLDRIVGDVASVKTTLAKDKADELDEIRKIIANGAANAGNWKRTLAGMVPAIVTATVAIATLSLRC